MTDGADKKKKLPVLTGPPKSVLPEVLPDPRRPREVSAPRSRTVAHMQRLFATAAAAMATSVACGKERGYAVVDPMPAPQRCFDPNGTVKSTVTPNGANRYTVTIELLPGVDAISFAKADGRAHAFKSSGGNQIDVSLRVGEKTAQKLVFEVDVPPDATTFIMLSGLQCTEPYAHGMQITLSSGGDAGALPTLNLSGEGYPY